MPVAVSINNLRVAEHASEDPDVPIELAHEEQLPMFRSNWPKKSSGSKLGIGGTESTVTTEKQSRDTAGFAVTSGSCGSMIPFCADDLASEPHDDPACADPLSHRCKRLSDLQEQACVDFAKCQSPSASMTFV